jgi:Domain of unknown function (DUF6484)
MQDTVLQNARIVLADVAAWSKQSGDGVSLATFAGFDAEGHFLVTLNDANTPVQAISTVGLTKGEIGVAIVVAFDKGQLRNPIIIGRVHEPGLAAVAVANVRLDGERVIVQARERIELRCGEASIVLTRAGKVLINGTYVLTRSKGANKIKGAYVGIN